MPTSCAPRCSAARFSNQFWRPQLYDTAFPGQHLANQLARSQPAISPKTAPCASDVMERGAAHAPRCGSFAIGKMIGIKQPQGFFRAFKQDSAYCL